MTDTPRTSKELLPCPFCGSHDLDDSASFVQCNRCGAEGPLPSRREALWNTRDAHEPETGQPFCPHGASEYCKQCEDSTSQQPSAGAAALLAQRIEDADVETIMQGDLLTEVLAYLKTGHLEFCDVNDRNPDGIKKPCNCNSTAQPSGACEWGYDAGDDVWQTGCGQMHVFMDRGPTDNDHKFCPYCGKTIDDLSRHAQTKSDVTP
jgi:hypothetical protein